MTDVETSNGFSPEPEEIDLNGEYWRTFMELLQRQGTEKQELTERHLREIISLHLDFPDDPGAKAYLEGMASKHYFEGTVPSPEVIKMIEGVRRQKEEESQT